jgi:hypothetical protein
MLCHNNQVVLASQNFLSGKALSIMTSNFYVFCSIFSTDCFPFSDTINRLTLLKF